MGMQLDYTVKSILILCVVGVVSFFVAQAVIPEKNAAPAVAPAERGAAAPARQVALTVAPGEEIPVVVVGDKPAATAITAPIAATAEKPVAAAGMPVPLEGAAAPAASYSFTPALYEPSPAGARSAPPRTMAARLAADAAPPDAKATPANTATQPSDAKTAPANAVSAAPPDTAQKKRPDAPSNIRIERAAVCSSIEDKSPRGIADRFPKNSAYVCYFTHVTGARDSAAAVIHRWYHEGKLIQTAILEIKSSSWRTHSKRNLTTVENPSGNWRVEAIDRQTGKMLESATFVVE
jgi:hypothetical protein